MYCVSIELQAKPGMAQAVIDLFREYVPLACGLPGCIRFELNQSHADPEAFLLYELYDNRGALLAHRGDELFQIWRPRIAALEASRTLKEFDTLFTCGQGRKESL